jgi:transcription elongation factor GreB
MAGRGAREAGSAGRPCITPEGYERLRQELERLWRVERPRVTREVGEAAALGDRSENAEYIYGKKRLREIDRRIEFLARRLEQLSVVTGPPPRPDRVFFGAFVTVENQAGEREEWRLVGADESDPAGGRISVESPLGRALLGRALDDEVEVLRPRGPVRVTVVEIRY